MVSLLLVQLRPQTGQLLRIFWSFVSLSGGPFACPLLVVQLVLFVSSIISTSTTTCEVRRDYTLLPWSFLHRSMLFLVRLIHMRGIGRTYYSFWGIVENCCRAMSWLNWEAYKGAKIFWGFIFFIGFEPQVSNFQDPRACFSASDFDSEFLKSGNQFSNLSSKESITGNWIYDLIILQHLDQAFRGL